MPKVLIEKLVFGGQGMGRINNQVAFIWGALPGEEVEFAIIKKKKNFLEGVATRILKVSPDRVKSLDDHYLSCSPWQTISYDKENEWKKIIAAETYARISGLTGIDFEIAFPKAQYEYRNKMEYNFTANQAGELSLAFHNRGTHRMKPIDHCVLADPNIQKISTEIVSELRTGGVPLSVLKSLVVRSGEDKVAAVLFVTDRDYVKNFFIPNPHGLSGLQIYYSNPLSPASVPTELLLSSGEAELQYVLNNTRLSFGLLSFFQINPEIFEVALKDIGNFIKGGRVVDYYCGVGAISLPLHPLYDKALLIEENAEAIDFAAHNIALNRLTNVTVQNALAEDVAPEIAEDDTVILDPPRTGLHKNVVMHLLKTQPKRIIYLSCGLDTHARDIDFLSVRYKPVFWKLYNFFPRTPHIEGLCVLERIK